MKYYISVCIPVVLVLLGCQREGLNTKNGGQALIEEKKDEISSKVDETSEKVDNVTEEQASSVVLTDVQATATEKMKPSETYVVPSGSGITIGQNGSESQKYAISSSPQSAPCESKLVDATQANQQILEPNQSYNLSVCESVDGKYTLLEEIAFVTLPEKVTPEHVQISEEKPTTVTVSFDFGKNPLDTEFAVAVMSTKGTGWLNPETKTLSYEGGMVWSQLSKEQVAALTKESKSSHQVSFTPETGDQSVQIVLRNKDGVIGELGEAMHFSIESEESEVPPESLADRIDRLESEIIELKAQVKADRLTSKDSPAKDELKQKRLKLVTLKNLNKSKNRAELKKLKSELVAQVREKAKERSEQIKAHFAAKKTARESDVPAEGAGSEAVSEKKDPTREDQTLKKEKKIIDQSERKVSKVSEKKDHDGKEQVDKIYNKRDRKLEKLKKAH